MGNGIKYNEAKEEQEEVAAKTKKDKKRDIYDLLKDGKSLSKKGFKDAIEDFVKKLTGGPITISYDKEELEFKVTDNDSVYFSVLNVNSENTKKMKTSDLKPIFTAIFELRVYDCFMIYLLCKFIKKLSGDVFIFTIFETMCSSLILLKEVIIPRKIFTKLDSDLQKIYDFYGQYLKIFSSSVNQKAPTPEDIALVMIDDYLNNKTLALQYGWRKNKIENDKKKIMLGNINAYLSNRKRDELIQNIYIILKNKYKPDDENDAINKIFNTLKNIYNGEKYDQIFDQIYDVLFEMTRYLKVGYVLVGANFAPNPVSVSNYNIDIKQSKQQEEEYEKQKIEFNQEEEKGDENMADVFKELGTKSSYVNDDFEKYDFVGDNKNDTTNLKKENITETDIHKHKLSNSIYIQLFYNRDTRYDLYRNPNFEKAVNNLKDYYNYEVLNENERVYKFYIENNNFIPGYCNVAGKDKKNNTFSVDVAVLQQIYNKLLKLPIHYLYFFKYMYKPDIIKNLMFVIIFGMADAILINESGNINKDALNSLYNQHSNVSSLFKLIRNIFLYNNENGQYDISFNQPLKTMFNNVAITIKKAFGQPCQISTLLSYMYELDDNIGIKTKVTYNTIEKMTENDGDEAMDYKEKIYNLFKNAIDYDGYTDKIKEKQSKANKEAYDLFKTYTFYLLSLLNIFLVIDGEIILEFGISDEKIGGLRERYKDSIFTKVNEIFVQDKLLDVNIDTEHVIEHPDDDIMDQYSDENGFYKKENSLIGTKIKPYVTLSAYGDTSKLPFLFNMLEFFDKRFVTDESVNKDYKKMVEDIFVRICQVHFYYIYKQLVDMPKNIENILSSILYMIMKNDIIIKYGFFVNNYVVDKEVINNRESFKVNAVLSSITSNEITFYKLAIFLRANRDANFSNVFGDVLLDYLKSNIKLYDQGVYDAIMSLYDETKGKLNMNDILDDVDKMIRNGGKSKVNTEKMKSIINNFRLETMYTDMVESFKDTNTNIFTKEEVKEISETDEYYNITRIIEDYLQEIEVIDIKSPEVLKKYLEDNVIVFANQHPTELFGDVDIIEPTKPDPYNYPNDLTKDFDKITSDTYRTFISNEDITIKREKNDDNTESETIKTELKNNQTAPKVEKEKDGKSTRNESRLHYFRANVFTSVVMGFMHEIQTKMNFANITFENGFFGGCSDMQEAIDTIISIWDRDIVTRSNSNLKKDVLEFISLLNCIKISDVYLSAIYLKNEEKYTHTDVLLFLRYLKQNLEMTYLSVASVLFEDDVQRDLIYCVCKELFSQIEGSQNVYKITKSMTQLLKAMTYNQEIVIDRSYSKMDSDAIKKMNYISVFMEYLTTLNLLNVQEVGDHKHVKPIAHRVSHALAWYIKNFDDEYLKKMPIEHVQFENTPYMEWYKDIFLNWIVTEKPLIKKSYEDQKARMKNDPIMYQAISNLIKNKNNKHIDKIASFVGKRRYAMISNLLNKVIYSLGMLIQDIETYMENMKELIAFFKKDEKIKSGVFWYTTEANTLLDITDDFFKLFRSDELDDIAIALSIAKEKEVKKKEELAKAFLSLPSPTNKAGSLDETIVGRLKEIFKILINVSKSYYTDGLHKKRYYTDGWHKQSRAGGSIVFKKEMKKWSDTISGIPNFSSDMTNIIESKFYQLTHLFINKAKIDFSKLYVRFNGSIKNGFLYSLSIGKEEAKIKKQLQQTGFLMNEVADFLMNMYIFKTTFKFEKRTYIDVKIGDVNMPRLTIVNGFTSENMYGMKALITRDSSFITENPYNAKDDDDIFTDFIYNIKDGKKEVKKESKEAKIESKMKKHIGKEFLEVDLYALTKQKKILKY